MADALTSPLGWPFVAVGGGSTGDCLRGFCTWGEGRGFFFSVVLYVGGTCGREAKFSAQGKRWLLLIGALYSGRCEMVLVVCCAAWGSGRGWVEAVGCLLERYWLLDLRAPASNSGRELLAVPEDFARPFLRCLLESFGESAMDFFSSLRVIRRVFRSLDRLQSCG